MPGPGGGGNGGGFGGGSFGGGGGRGFGGGGYRGPRGPRFGFFPGFGFFGPRFGYGGGCLGGLLGLIFLPLIVLILVFALLFFNVTSAVSNVANGGIISYDERVFQQYADSEYSKHFGASPETYEDNILIVVLTNEEHDGYYTIAWVGDNVNYRINEMFGNQRTAFGQAMNASIAPDYTYSLDSNLAMVMNRMQNQISALGLSSSFNIPPASTETEIRSRLTNYSDLSLNQNTVDTALARFTEETDIPAVIVVNTMEGVFGKNIPIGDIIFLVIMVAVIIVMIVWIVKIVKKNKNNRGGGNQNNYNQGNNNYNYNYNYNNNYNTGYNNSYNNNYRRH